MKNILCLILSVLFLFVQGAFIHPILWQHGSSSAFDIDLVFWLIALVWFGLSILMVYSSASGSFKKYIAGK